MTRRGGSFPLRLVCNTPGCEGATITMGGDLRHCWPLQSRITHELELNQARSLGDATGGLQGYQGRLVQRQNVRGRALESPSGLRGLRNPAAGAIPTDNGM